MRVVAMNMNMRSWILVMIFVLLLEGWGNYCHGCWEDEKIALLRIKSYFNHSRPFDDSHFPSDWGIDADCCNWQGVTCDETTKRVVELDLKSTKDQGFGGWYLNASLFLPFKHLLSLDLTANQILGCIEYEGSNEFNMSIILSLRGLSSLISSDLSNNSLKGIVDIQDLNYLASLEELNLRHNEIEGFKSFRGDDEEVLSNLQSLDLGFNNLDNSILSSLKGLSSLKQLDLNDNQLKGSINVKELNALSQLEELDLSRNEITRFEAAGESKSWNNISALFLEGISTNASHVLEVQSLLESLQGSFPNLNTLHLTSNNLRGTSFRQGSHHPNNLETLYLDYSSVDENFLQSLGTLVSLQILHMRELNGCLLAQGLCELNQLQVLLMSRNNVSGNLPSCMANLTSLRNLDLSGNQFTGNISLSPLRALTSLQFLYLSHNRFQIPMTLGPFFNHTKLEVLYAEGNNIFSEAEEHSLAPKFQLFSVALSGYGYGVKFPKFLYYQHKLQYVDLSHIQMYEGFPHWLLENNTDLYILRLVNNSLLGQVQLPRHSHTSLGNLDISENCLRGHVPEKIGALLPNLYNLNLSGNSFSGSIPPSLVNMSLMAFLDLSNNGLSGEVPAQLAGSTLNILVLSNNILHGQSFLRNMNLHYLVSLQLDGNQLTGPISDSLFNSSSLKILDLSHNNLYGNLPQWIGNMSALRVLDLSENNISGSLRSNFPSSIEQVYLSKNRLQGSLENAFYNSSSLVALDLSRNYFIGSIPKWVDTLSNLSYLLLRNNNFKGQIPTELCKLDKLRLIDFSHNYLSGHILPCLKSGSTWDTTEISGRTSVSFSYGGNYAFQPSVEFTTKSISYSYEGRLFSYMSGIDLSCNNLMGEIPPELGTFSIFKVLNLSHNNLVGPIPSTLSNLKEIESLDLSYNNLDGKIPSQLTQLYQLAVFTVAHNNLSGKTPDMVAQFSTFDNRSYEDNPFLCGPPLTKSCNEHPSPPSSPKNSGKHNEETGFIDMDAFYPSFLASYVMVLLVMAAVLYINSHWRQTWFHFVEECINNTYYFMVDNLPMLSRYRASQPCV